MAKKGMRDFALQEENGNEIGFFSCKSPSQAALKAAKRGHKDIRIRELGYEEGAWIHWREGSGRQVLGRAGLDGRQNMEASGQKGGHR